MGKVKRALMEKQPERNDVDAQRNKGEVWIGDVRVAKWDGTKMKLRGEALELKARIEELIAESKSTRLTVGASDVGRNSTR